MEDRFGKYLRLFGTIFFSVIGFIVAFALLLLLTRVFFGMLSYIPWFRYFYMVLILVVPVSLFVPAYIVYIKRTASHPSAPIRYISYALFYSALVAWAIFFVWDVTIFAKYAYDSIGMYHSYDMIFLAANVACFFIAGVMQALTTEKEKDWMERDSIKTEL